MLQNNSKKYRWMLERKFNELSIGLQRRDDIGIEKAADPVDDTQFATEREFAIRTLDRESHLFRRIQRALDRIGNGSYGICLQCEEDIKPNRLDAAPWAEYCILCQEAADRHELEHRQAHPRIDSLLAA